MGEALPKVGQIVSFLREGYGDFVLQMPQRVRVHPEEIWIPGLATWVRADGFSFCGDARRGYAYPGRIERWRIRRAVKVFRRLVNKTASLIPPESGGTTLNERNDDDR